MVIEIVCGKCNTKIGSTRMLKSIKSTSSVENGKCPSCGHAVSLTEFALDVQKAPTGADDTR